MKPGAERFGGPSERNPRESTRSAPETGQGPRSGSTCDRTEPLVRRAGPRVRPQAQKHGAPAIVRPLAQAVVRSLLQSIVAAHANRRELQEPALNRAGSAGGWSVQVARPWSGFPYPRHVHLTFLLDDNHGRLDGPAALVSAGRSFGDDFHGKLPRFSDRASKVGLFGRFLSRASLRISTSRLLPPSWHSSSRMRDFISRSVLLPVTPSSPVSAILPAPASVRASYTEDRAPQHFGGHHRKCSCGHTGPPPRSEASRMRPNADGGHHR
ncbi:hypothetical protein SAMN05421751_10725 [Jhaorihella thermophila]|uniref:Uncharacterized protein n=1 Tax=Jhaorihella thermophila TaxID=488547 RepID=A0A1H5VZ45_9RHOB|nr:hypothetical protein SAMN05421751_10725 [Jhaorihella thermophila]